MKVIQQQVDVFNVFTKKEAVELIALLTAQLADTNAPDVQTGACATFPGGNGLRYTYSIEPHTSIAVALGGSGKETTEEVLQLAAKGGCGSPTANLTGMCRACRQANENDGFERAQKALPVLEQTLHGFPFVSVGVEFHKAKGCFILVVEFEGSSSPSNIPHTVGGIPVAFRHGVKRPRLLAE